VAQKGGPAQWPAKAKSPKEMPLAHDRQYAEWVREQKRPTLDDKRQVPSDWPQELEELAGHRLFSSATPL
jgi:hypothetical protein